MANAHHIPSKVSIAGAGPGDVELLTLKTKKVLELADVVLYDNLVNKEILQFAAPHCQMIPVGKKPYGESTPQQSIHELMAFYAEAGLKVVRLKGGDPLIFGRGGEEAAYLAQRGIPFEILPGVTSATAAAAFSGIPLTHREISQAVMFVAGHKKNDTIELQWPVLAAFNGTLVFYMGVKNLPEIAQQLLVNDKSPDTPVAVIEKASLPGQKIIHADLENIVLLAQQTEIKGPALIIVGEVVSLMEYTKYWNEYALYG